MKIVSYESYLTEDKLGDVLREVFGDVVPQKRIDLERGHAKVDFYVPSIRTAVEFDGDAHYRLSKQVERDNRLAAACGEGDVSLVQIPYWVQLDKRVAVWAFGPTVYEEFFSSVELRVDFPHGFVSSTCVLPADFSALGWVRFVREYASLAARAPSVTDEVYESLRSKIEEVGYLRTIGGNNADDLLDARRVEVLDAEHVDTSNIIATLSREPSSSSRRFYDRFKLPED